MSINWYPGHMHKATKEIKESLPKVDVIIEVLDARIPYSSENPVIAQLRKLKPCIKLLNKSDLAAADLTQQWLEHFKQQDNVSAIAVSSQNPEQLKQVFKLIKKIVSGSVAAVRNIDAMIMGIPNVGKSTIINTLAGKQFARTGNEPAITKGQQRIDCRNGIVLIDTPGILWPKLYSENSAYRLATTGAIKNTAVTYEDIAFFAAEYLLQTYPELLKNRYQLQELPLTVLDFFEVLGQKRGCLAKGGRVDLNQISKIFISEFREATIGRISLETPAMVVNEKILVAQLIAEREAKQLARKQKRAPKPPTAQ